MRIINEGMEMIERQTKSSDGTPCVKFIKRKEEKNYLNIIDEKGCWSYVGKFIDPKAQILSLNVQKCLKVAIVAHELIHALG